MFSTIGYYICIPFAWLVRFFYELTGSYGVAIILFTLVIKLIMLPFQMKSKKSMMRMSRMSGRMQEIQKKYANNQAKMGEEMQKLYAEEGVSPMGGCLWSFLPLPILIALYSIIRQPVTHFMMLSEDVMYSIINHLAGTGASVANIVRVAEDGAMELGKNGLPQLLPYGQINLVKEITSQLPDYGASVDGWINMNYNFLGLDLTANPSTGFTNFTLGWACIGLLLIPILAGGSQFLLSRITMKQQPQQEGPAARSTKSMMYMMPLFSVYIAFIMPAALGIYWIAQSGFSVIQEVILGKFFNKKLEEEEAARYEARQSDRQRRMEEAKALQEQRKQQAEQKQSLKEKRKAAQEAKALKAKKAGSSTTEAGRIGDRPYARGRAYREERYESED
ncbi:YidC/Oxa1 family membrane protein insertase [uncultured Oscillibacter sp.]|uniref:YidC/Oxa1 family membrane protein insertase n=1 Tax=uncultured Oscillibacter sp. TaxID=876091 RepID=UPI0025E0DCE1|nr:membrane protein insertase YidC [uncultured Oscillibacter sp.]